MSVILLSDELINLDFSKKKIGSQKITGKHNK